MKNSDAGWTKTDAGKPAPKKAALKESASGMWTALAKELLIYLVYVSALIFCVKLYVYLLDGQAIFEEYNEPFFEYTLGK